MEAFATFRGHFNSIVGLQRNHKDKWHSGLLLTLTSDGDVLRVITVRVVPGGVATQVQGELRPITGHIVQENGPGPAAEPCPGERLSS